MMRRHQTLIVWLSYCAALAVILALITHLAFS